VEERRLSARIAHNGLVEERRFSAALNGSENWALAPVSFSGPYPMTADVFEQSFPQLDCDI